MPQAPEELCKKFPGSDQQALQLIAQHFVVSRGGVITKIDPKYQPTDEEWDAVDYLFMEWDYCYEEVLNDSGNG